MDSLDQAPGSRSSNGQGQGQKSWVGLRPNEIPSTDELKSMFSPYAGPNGFKIDDVIEDRIWDTKTVTASTTNNLSFFTSAGTLPTTNMKSAGQLPSQEAFYLTGIKFSVFSEADAALDFGDAKEIMRRMYFNLSIANKPYVSGDGMETLNPLSPLVLNTRYFTTVVTKTWNLRIRQVIPPQVNFECATTLTMGAFGTSTTYHLRCYLIGYRYRSVQ